MLASRGPRVPAKTAHRAPLTLFAGVAWASAFFARELWHSLAKAAKDLRKRKVKSGFYLSLNGGTIATGRRLEKHLVQRPGRTGAKVRASGFQDYRHRAAIAPVWPGRSKPDKVL